MLLLSRHASRKRCGLSPPLHAQFSKEARHIVLHRLLGEVHGLADLAVRHALADVIEDASLLIGQAIESSVMLLPLAKSVEYALGSDRIEERLTDGDLSDGFDEVIASDVLQDVAGRARHDGVEQRLIVRI